MRKGPPSNATIARPPHDARGNGKGDEVARRSPHEHRETGSIAWKTQGVPRNRKAAAEPSVPGNEEAAGHVQELARGTPGPTEREARREDREGLQGDGDGREGKGDSELGRRACRRREEGAKQDLVPEAGPVPPAERLEAPPADGGAPRLVHRHAQTLPTDEVFGRRMLPQKGLDHAGYAGSWPPERS